MIRKGVVVGDHPRVCGEQERSKRPGTGLPGSPPRVRGTATYDVPQMTRLRITPACAGNRNRSGKSSGRYKDHPRVCGEQAIFHPDKIPVGGSPPRVRGTAFISTVPSGKKRITPACAGNRALFLCLRHAIKDHPRVCGEQVVLPETVIDAVGSPPRVRGTDYFQRVMPATTRITPACAGNRRMDTSCWMGRRDHPRVCGEQLFRYQEISGKLGSPPRVRGTAFPSGSGWRLRRITPACAGNSIVTSPHIRPSGDHPRVCGEQ